MSDKKITFSAVDNGVSSAFDKLRRQSNELMKDFIKDARQYSSSGKEQVQYIEEQIKAIERRNRVEAEGRRINAEQKLSVGMKASTAMERGEAKNDYRSELKNITSESKEDAAQVRLLRELIETVKLSAKEEIREDKKNVEREITAESDDPEVAFKRSIQRDLLEEQDKRERRRGGGGGDDGDDEEGDSDGGGGKKKKSLASGARGFADRNSRAVMGAIGLASFASIGGIIAKLVSEGNELQGAGGSLQGQTSRDYSNFGGVNSFGVGQAASWGMKRADLMGYGQNLASTRGYASAGYDASGRTWNADLSNETLKLTATEKAFGMQSGFTSGLSRYQQFDTNNRETSGDIQNMIKIMKAEGMFRGGDFSRLTELLETSNQIASSQSEILEQINTDTNAQVMASFQRVGGSFSDARSGKRIATVNSALTNPDNDFKQAFNYSTLRRLKPEASFFELQEMQEKGLSQKGFLGESMKSLKGYAGNNKELFLQLIKSRMGMSASQSRQLGEAFMKDNTIFDNIGGVDNALKKSDMNMFGRANANTPAIPKMMAKINDVAGTAGDKAIKFVDKQIQEVASKGLDKYVEKMSTEIKDAFVTGAKEITDQVGESISNTFSVGATAIRAELSSWIDKNFIMGPGGIPMYSPH